MNTQGPLAWAVWLSTTLICTSALAAEKEWLSLGSKSWAPSVYSKRGAGTANAVAEARVTRQEIADWCANWSPGDKNCVAQTLASIDLNQVYRASADCLAGRITAVDGQRYTFAGVWDNRDIGGGRTQWRDQRGKIVGRDNASGGLGISQQWEVLCPGPLKIGRTPAPPAAPSPPAHPALVVAAPYAVGESIEARYGRDWVPGRIQSIRQMNGSRGPEWQYEVRLANGQRGIIPARMLRKAPGH